MNFIYHNIFKGNNKENFCIYDKSPIDLFKYKLKGVINHFGIIENGHYICNINIEKRWYTFNDSVVSRINDIKYNSDAVCLLIYERIN